MNRVINPWLVEHQAADRSAGEIGLLEHIGRASGKVRVSPVHPVPIEGGYRIVVPLGAESQWARNVLAAGHCRLQIGDSVHELDEPTMLSPLRVSGIAPFAGHAMEWLGFRYLLLHQFSEHPGTLASVTGSTAIPVVETPVPVELVQPAPVA
jgi:deazaflavin-dependent oxidoreductase (nitroreductase family)